MVDEIRVDVVVVGGGIAGLWLVNRLRNLGYRVVLLEKDGLGGWQSLHSQGIIHGGIKYTLAGKITAVSDSIADMPGRWREAMEGNGQVDLRSARQLSDHHYMWSTAALASKMTAFFASKAVRGRVKPLGRHDAPEIFRNERFKGNLYALNEIVLDIPSVASALHAPVAGVCYRMACGPDNVERGPDGSLTGLNTGGANPIRIVADRYVLAAGGGNADLLDALGETGVSMQRRPLHMVVVKHQYPHPIFAHCLGGGAKPIVTITTHPTRDGGRVWYLGGNLAEEGVRRADHDQVAEARAVIAKRLPWVDLGEAHWESFMIDRAEPRQSKLVLPDAAFARAHANVIVGWPTKLALAPDFSDKVVAMLTEQGVRPSGADPMVDLPLPRAQVTDPIWEKLLR